MQNNHSKSNNIMKPNTITIKTRKTNSLQIDTSTPFQIINNNNINKQIIHQQPKQNLKANSSSSYTTPCNKVSNINKHVKNQQKMQLSSHCHAHNSANSIISELQYQTLQKQQQETENHKKDDNNTIIDYESDQVNADKQEYKIIIKICDGVYIGGQMSIWDVDTMLSNYITHLIIINSTSHTEHDDTGNNIHNNKNNNNNYVPKMIQYIHTIQYNFHKNSKQNTNDIHHKYEDAYKKIVKFIKHAHQQGQSCLIISKQNNGSSVQNTAYDNDDEDQFIRLYQPATIVCGYFMYLYKWSMLKSMQFVINRLTACQKIHAFLEKYKDGCVYNKKQNNICSNTYNSLITHFFPQIPHIHHSTANTHNKKPVHTFDQTYKNIPKYSLKILQQHLLSSLSNEQNQKNRQLSYNWNNGILIKQKMSTEEQNCMLTQQQMEVLKEQLVLTNTYINCCGVVGIGDNRPYLQILKQHSKQKQKNKRNKSKIIQNKDKLRKTTRIQKNNKEIGTSTNRQSLFSSLRQSINKYNKSFSMPKLKQQNKKKYKLNSTQNQHVQQQQIQNFVKTTRQSINLNKSDIYNNKIAKNVSEVSISLNKNTETCKNKNKRKVSWHNNIIQQSQHTENKQNAIKNSLTINNNALQIQTSTPIISPISKQILSYRQKLKSITITNLSISSSQNNISASNKITHNQNQINYKIKGKSNTQNNSKYSKNINNNAANKSNINERSKIVVNVIDIINNKTKLVQKQIHGQTHRDINCNNRNNNNELKFINKKSKIYQSRNKLPTLTQLLKQNNIIQNSIINNYQQNNKDVLNNYKKCKTMPHHVHTQAQQQQFHQRLPLNASIQHHKKQDKNNTLCYTQANTSPNKNQSNINCYIYNNKNEEKLQIQGVCSQGNQQMSYRSSLDKNNLCDKFMRDCKVNNCSNTKNSISTIEHINSINNMNMNIKSPIINNNNGNNSQNNTSITINSTIQHNHKPNDKQNNNFSLNINFKATKVSPPTQNQTLTLASSLTKRNKNNNTSSSISIFKQMQQNKVDCNSVNSIDKNSRYCISANNSKNCSRNSLQKQKQKINTNRNKNSIQNFNRGRSQKSQRSKAKQREDLIKQTIQGLKKMSFNKKSHHKFVQLANH